MENITKNIVAENMLKLLASKYYPTMDISAVLSCRILLGKNAENNWTIYKLSDRSDTIFHLEKFSSPYVIINIEIDKLTPEQICMAALLCKSKSKYKALDNIKVFYTPLSNTILGDILGSFVIKNHHKKYIINI
jgi:hypothetical protein